MKILDLFCGGGGAGMGIHQAFPNAEITGIDIIIQPKYPFKFIQADALIFPLRGFDFIWASPPCQHYSTLKSLALARPIFKAVIPELRKKLIKSGIPYAIENVPGSPLINPTILCGSHFNLKTKNGAGLRRHRLFETSFFIKNTFICQHPSTYIGIFGSRARDSARERRHYSKDKATRGIAPIDIYFTLKDAQTAMGINWLGFKELSQAVPPAYAKWILTQWKNSGQEVQR